MNMTVEALRTAPGAAPPAGLDAALRALWFLARDDWAAAHGCVQAQEGEKRCDWVHAHLHRVEGDAGNARYWYRRAGQPVSNAPLAEEWAAIAAALLALEGLRKEVFFF